MLSAAMPALTALLHTSNDARRIGRALDSLRACDELLVIDHASTDATLRIAREHGARVQLAAADGDSGARHAANDWLLCLLPAEALSESLEATLLEWKQEDPGNAVAYALALRQETVNGWQHCGPEVRLVDRRKLSWTGPLPPQREDAPSLCGDLLRFADPQG
jgi:glycosyltransferase involved in cell wall biosynthesis